MFITIYQPFTFTSSSISKHISNCSFVYDVMCQNLTNIPFIQTKLEITLALLKLVVSIVKTKSQKCIQLPDTSSPLYGVWKPVFKIERVQENTFLNPPYLNHTRRNHWFSGSAPTIRSQSRAQKRSIMGWFDDEVIQTKSNKRGKKRREEASNRMKSGLYFIKYTEVIRTSNFLQSVSFYQFCLKNIFLF